MKTVPHLNAALLFLLTAPVYASGVDEVMAAERQVAIALQEADCDTLVSMMATQLSYYANGQQLSRDQYEQRCRSLELSVAGGRKPCSESVDAHLLGDGVGYTVRALKWRAESSQTVHEVVTTLWRKTDEGWKMIHVQATAVPDGQS